MQPQIIQTIYTISNIDNGKFYIGKTSQKLGYRWHGHVNRARHGVDTYFYNAIRKYGEDKFVMEPLAYAYSDEEASELEKAWIAVLDATNKEVGYNSTFGGDGARHTEETKKKLSEIQKGRKPTPEALENLRKAMEPLYPLIGQNIKKAWAEGKFENKVKGHSDLMKKAWAEGRMKGNIGTKKSEEAKVKLSASLRLSWAKRKAEKSL